MIEKLTKAQINKFPKFIKKWTDIGLSTEPANRKEAERGVVEMYKVAGLKKPKIVWCDSPMSQGLTRMIVQKLENDGELKKILGKNVENSVWVSVGDSVRVSVRASVGASVWDSVGVSVGDSVWDSVWVSVGDSVGVSVRASVWASVWASVGASVRASVGASVRDSVRASVWASVWASVGASVGASVWASVGASVGDSGYGQHDANWLAFYDFFKEACELEKETKKLSGLWKVSKNAGWFLPHENICWISERHNKLNRNSRGQLHSDTEMAVQYPDGWGIYALNGVRFPEELWKKVVSKEMPFEEILKIQDIDQRTQAMRYGDVQKFFEHTKAEMLNKSELTGNELWKIPQSARIFTQDSYFEKYECPSTGRIYMSGIEPEIGKKADADEAMAWKHWMSKENYLAMVRAGNEA